MKQVVETAYRLARFDTTVLLLGESGVGKDLVARIIHEASPRMETGTFVKINCGAIPEDLLESELFGYKGGAFTGANKEGKPGYFEVADKGTLFLDEIGDLPIRLQVKLLSVIQDQEVSRIGDVNKKKIDVRIIAATNQDLDAMVKNGRFREDLYYRLNVVPICIPPLRERKEEIPFLLAHYAEKYNKKYNAHHRLSKEATDVLSAYRWPGNVRELANLVEHLIVVTNETALKPEHLPPKYLSGDQERTEENLPVRTARTLREEVEKFEGQLIKRVLSQTSNYEEAAHLLGISLSTLTRRMRSVNNDRHK
jgi:transcriptional regulator with PAS, ATPase and Fis domain